MKIQEGFTEKILMQSVGGLTVSETAEMLGISRAYALIVLLTLCDCGLMFRVSNFDANNRHVFVYYNVNVEVDE